MEQMTSHHLRIRPSLGHILSKFAQRMRNRKRKACHFVTKNKRRNKSSLMTHYSVPKGNSLMGVEFDRQARRQGVLTSYLINGVTRAPKMSARLT